MDNEDSLQEDLKRSNLEGCTCEYRWGCPGKIYGIPLMDQFIRLNTVKGCPHHDQQK